MKKNKKNKKTVALYRSRSVLLRWNITNICYMESILMFCCSGGNGLYCIAEKINLIGDFLYARTNEPS